MKTVYLVLLAGVMTVCAACTTAPLAPPTTNISGNWVGTWQYENVQQGSGDIRGSFQQDGASLAGNFNVTGPVLNRTANVTGAVTGNDIILNKPSTGRLTVSGNQITGTIITGIIDGLNPLRQPSSGASGFARAPSSSIRSTPGSSTTSSACR